MANAVSYVTIGWWEKKEVVILVSTKVNLEGVSFIRVAEDNNKAQMRILILCLKSGHIDQCKKYICDASVKKGA